MIRYTNEIEPIQVELEDLDGNKKVFTVKQLSAVDMQKIHELEIKKDDKIFDRMREEVAMFFGGDPKDFVRYDVRMLKQVILDISTELRNPLPKVQDSQKKS